jgi:hypothetical protein
MTRDKEWVEVDFDAVEHETPDSWLIRVDRETYWLPKSMCRNFDAQSKSVEVEEWIAVDRGLV